MHITLKTHIKAEAISVDKDNPFTLAELADEFKNHSPYPIMAARVDGKIRQLTFTVEKDSQVELLDIREHSAYIAYQNTISMVYLKAVDDIVDNAEVEIDNSLNKGFYTLIYGAGEITESFVERIKERMEELIAVDLNIEGTDVLNKYSLQGYISTFYGMMAPSTGYVKEFEVRKYADGVLLRFPYPSQPDRIPEWVDDINIHRAFVESKETQNIMGVTELKSLNDKIKTHEYTDLILMSEALHEKKLAMLADEIKNSGKRIILITGPSSSGKTTTAKRLCLHLKLNGMEPLYLGTDDYFVERKDTPIDETGKPNYENLEALDIELFNDNLNSLLKGETVDIPEFDFIDGVKIFGRRLTRIDKGQPIVIEGIHALNNKLTKFIDENTKYKVYISPFTQLNLDAHNRLSTSDARKLRRLVRDFSYRNKPAEETLRQWSQVRAGEDKNIFPFNSVADVVFNTVLPYEVAVLKKYAAPLLKSIDASSDEYSEAVRLLEILEPFEVIEDEKAIPSNSILREFIGGSVFVD